MSHEITNLEDGYRPVIAFKSFRMAEDDSEDMLPAGLKARVKRIIDQIPAPFGPFTTHKYSIGATKLNGFDALLSACARSRNDTQILLPVDMSLPFLVVRRLATRSPRALLKVPFIRSLELTWIFC
jgi:hypothetical protein